MTRTCPPVRPAIVFCVLCACEVEATSIGMSAGFGDGTAVSPGSNGSDSTSSADDGTDETGETVRLDVGGAGHGSCVVVNDGLDARPKCDERSPPDSFELALQWSWTGAEGFDEVLTTPLVMNITDDNKDGEVNLCDTPDIIVAAFFGTNYYGALFALDGETGSVHWQSEAPVWGGASPAIGDIDGDGSPDIVALAPDMRIVAFESDGTLKWRSSDPWDATAADAPLTEPEAAGGSIAIADLDNDGFAEIIAGSMVWDHRGALLSTFGDHSSYYNNASVAVDLDGDGDLEVLLGRSAFHHDGSVYFLNKFVAPGLPHVANLDDDPEPEVLLTNRNGFTLMQHDGTVTVQALRPLDVPPGLDDWMFPAAVHDFDGDGRPEIAVNVGGRFGVWGPDLSNRWLFEVDDESGAAGGTAFDFLGDGSAEAMFADESRFHIFGDDGGVLLDAPRSSKTLAEYPVVADVDNDGSAEIVVTSSRGHDGEFTAPTVQVFRDVQDRWVRTRRVWNQHTYHVTNVSEDGSIPIHEPPHWASFNTFRTNSQLDEDGTPCIPPPEG